LQDAIDLLPYLKGPGVNAVELMPPAEYEGCSWGYGNSHYSHRIRGGGATSSSISSALAIVTASP
jgi:hypothetical protein